MEKTPETQTPQRQQDQQKTSQPQSRPARQSRGERPEARDAEPQNPEAQNPGPQNPEPQIPEPRRQPRPPKAQGRTGPENKISTLASMADVVAVVPHRMGFHPHRSLVVILLGEDGAWIATARHDWLPGASLASAVTWLQDICLDAAGAVVGAYGEETAAREVVEAAVAKIPGPVRGYLVSPQAWGVLTSRGWEMGGLEELWSSPAQLELWQAGSVPADRPPGHPLPTPTPGLAERWERAWLPASDWSQAWAALDRESAGEQMPADDDAMSPWRLWAKVLTRIQQEPGLAAWDTQGLARAKAACAFLADSQLRDGLLIVCASAHDQGAHPGEVLLGAWQGTPDWEELALLERFLEQCAPLLGGALKAEALCLLAWVDWAHGRGSMAAATLRDALEVAPGHRLAELMGGFVDTGTVPNWLRSRWEGSTREY